MFSVQSLQLKVKMELNPAFLDNSGGGGSGGDWSRVGAASSSSAAEEDMAIENNGEGGGGGYGVEERGSVGEGGNRWPSEETSALIDIRSEMNLAFRNSALKAPLWDEVSKKLSVLGYKRSPRKCREKFENLVKYHKRKKICPSGRQNGKNYRFFEQLQMFDNQPSLPMPSTNTNQQPNLVETTTTSPPPPQPIVIKPQSLYTDFVVPCPNQTQTLNMDNVTPSTPTTPSSGRDSEDSISVSRKKELADFCNELMKHVLEKQEILQNQLLDALERCERERIAREEEWRKQLMERIQKKQEDLARDRIKEAEKDAVIMAFLQKISNQTIHGQFPESAVPLPDKQQLQISTHLSDSIDNRDDDMENNVNNSSENVLLLDRGMEKQDDHVIGENYMQSSGSRWPKTEVEALVRVRLNLDMQYKDNAHKGPLWEEVSVAMKKIGYNRNAKRCKEKWENIHKYYKRVKESQKKRPESSKTCQYFHLLDSIYEKRKSSSKRSDRNLDILMETMNQQQQSSLTENVMKGAEKDEDDEDEDKENEKGNGYQVVSIHPSSHI